MSQFRFQTQPFSNQKRWLTEEEILRAIDRTRERQRKLCAEAETDRADAECLTRRAHHPKTKSDQSYSDIAMARQKFSESEEKFARASRMDKRIKTLGEKLAAFRTQLMTPITTDPAVV